MSRDSSEQLFETERLVARQLSLQDVPALTEILNDPEGGICTRSLRMGEYIDVRVSYVANPRLLSWPKMTRITTVIRTINYRRMSAIV